MKPRAIWCRFQLEVVLKRVWRIRICTRYGGDVSRSFSLHDGGLPALRLVDVAVMQPGRGEHRTGQFKRERLLTRKADWTTMPHGCGRLLRAARGFGNGSFHFGI